MEERVDVQRRNKLGRYLATKGSSVFLIIENAQNSHFLCASIVASAPFHRSIPPQDLSDFVLVSSRNFL